MDNYLNIEYCNNNCPIGRAAREYFLENNNSAFDAAYDFRSFASNCFKACQLKSMHSKCEGDI